MAYQTMDLSIIIVNWNTAELLTQCLNSIYHAAPQLYFEIIVVDNGSTDNSMDVVNEYFPDLRVVRNTRNLGFARANNQGLAIGTGRYFMLLNSDTVVPPGEIDKLVHFADQSPEIGVLGPRLLNMDGTLQESWSSFPSLWSEFVGKNFRERRPETNLLFAYDVDWISGACMLVRAKTIEEIGMLDEAYFMYSEEADWCYRIKSNGWKVIYLSNAEIIHLGGGSADRASLIQLTLLYQSKIYFFQKNYGRRKAVLLRYELALSNSYGLVRRFFHLFRNDRKTVWHRMVIQSKLIGCLLLNRFPEVMS